MKGAREGADSPDLLVANNALSRLSYGPVCVDDLWYPVNFCQQNGSGADMRLWEYILDKVTVAL